MLKKKRKEKKKTYALTHQSTNMNSSNPSQIISIAKAFQTLSPASQLVTLLQPSAQDSHDLHLDVCF